MSAIKIVAQAQEHLESFYDDVRDVRLEEIERLEDGGWRVTLSYTGGVSGTGLESAVGVFRRTYKLFEFDSLGSFRSMKIRELERS